MPSQPWHNSLSTGELFDERYRDFTSFRVKNHSFAAPLPRGEVVFFFLPLHHKRLNLSILLLCSNTHILAMLCSIPCLVWLHLVWSWLFVIGLVVRLLLVAIVVLLVVSPMRPIPSFDEYCVLAWPMHESSRGNAMLVMSRCKRRRPHHLGPYRIHTMAGTGVPPVPGVSSIGQCDANQLGQSKDVSDIDEPVDRLVIILRRPNHHHLRSVP
mmetsp:Transcript_5030/g.11285  ORF Transcript_5030/g.11285 Transcript_5030/m.11285 type:complete len:212 (+) Transcript_5030:85-720(+)